MNQRRVALCLCGLILLGSYFAVNQTSSWLHQGFESGVTEAKFSEVRYLPSLSADPAVNGMYGGFAATTEELEEGLAYMHLGKELLKGSEGDAETPRPLRLENQSGVETNVRLKLTGTVSRTEIGLDGVETVVSKPLYSVQRTGVWYLGVKSESGQTIPLIRLDFGGSDANGYRWVEAADSADGTSGMADTACRWDLQVKGADGVYTVAVPAAVESGTGSVTSLFDVLTSVRVVDDMSIGGVGTEDLFFKLYSKTDVSLCLEYYARQADAMDWSDWPATYRTEVML